MKLLNTERVISNDTENHASTIVYHKGHRVMAWFGGIQEGERCGIWLKLDDKEPVKMLKPSGPPYIENSMWNPVLFEADGDLLLLYKEGKFCDSWQTFMSRCEVEEDKLTLTQPQIFPAGLHASVKTKPYMEGEHIICGSSVETRWDWAVYVEAYKYEKRHLGLVGVSHPIKNTSDFRRIKGILQPTIWKEGDVYKMFCRSSTDAYHIYYSESKPGNPLTWMPAVSTNLYNPNSAVDVLQHSNGKKYLVYNPSYTERVPLSIAEFEMNDKHVDIKEQLDIDLEEGWEDLYIQRRTKELSYPFMIENPDGDIDISYTFCRKEIRVSTIEV